MTPRGSKQLSSLLVLLCLACPAKAGNFQHLYTAGHADVSVDYQDGELRLGYHLDERAVIDGVALAERRYAEASEISVVIPETLHATGDPGLPAPFGNAPLYSLPAFGGASVRPFLGFGAEGVPGGVFVDDMLSLTLTGMSGPAGGLFALYYPFSVNIPLVNTADGVSFVDMLDVNASGHGHFAMVFTAAGAYDLEFAAYGTLVGSGETVATEATIRFLVGDPDPAAVPEPASLAMLGLGTLGLPGAARRLRRAA